MKLNQCVYATIQQSAVLSIIKFNIEQVFESVFKTDIINILALRYQVLEFNAYDLLW